MSMGRKWLMGLAGIMLAAAGSATGQTTVTHEQLQAVNSNGEGTYDDSTWVVIEGIVLNAPEKMLNPRAGIPSFMGGQWQMFIQGEGDDHAATAVWMGQRYGDLSFLPASASYSDSEWLSELCRVNRDPNSGYVFQPGDRVQVTGKFLFFAGKTNINEQHDKEPASDFTVELVRAGVGLPVPEVVSLSDLKDKNDDFIFDAARQSGCEYYQGRLVRIEGVQWVDGGAGWGPGAMLTVTDGSGRTFPVKLGIGSGIASYGNNLGEPFDVVGILNQEDSGDNFFGEGYQLWVTDYDGSGMVLRDRGQGRGNLSGDANGDWRVDLDDLDILAGQWLAGAPGLSGCP